MGVTTHSLPSTDRDRWVYSWDVPPPNSDDHEKSEVIVRRVKTGAQMDLGGYGGDKLIKLNKMNFCYYLLDKDRLLVGGYINKKQQQKKKRRTTQSN